MYSIPLNQLEGKQVIKQPVVIPVDQMMLIFSIFI